MTNQTDQTRSDEYYAHGQDNLYRADPWGSGGQGAHPYDPDAEMEATSILTADERDVHREERNRRLGVRTREPELPQAADPRPYVRTTDKFHGSLALLLLRLLVAAVVGYHGWQHLMHMNQAGGTREFFEHSLLPKPGWFAWGVPIAELTIAALLVLGLLTRLAGLVLVALQVVMLAFFVWGKGTPFPAGQTSFRGESELILAGIGLLLLLLGSGGAGIDAAFRRDRADRRARKLAGDY